MKSTERLLQCEGCSFWALKGTLTHPTGRPWANLREAFLLECSQSLLENSSGHLCRGKSPSIIIWEMKFPQKYAVSDHHKHFVEPNDSGKASQVSRCRPGPMSTLWLPLPLDKDSGPKDLLMGSQLLPCHSLTYVENHPAPRKKYKDAIRILNWFHMMQYKSWHFSSLTPLLLNNDNLLVVLYTNH